MGGLAGRGPRQGSEPPQTIAVGEEEGDATSSCSMRRPPLVYLSRFNKSPAAQRNYADAKRSSTSRCFGAGDSCRLYARSCLPSQIGCVACSACARDGVARHYVLTLPCARSLSVDSLYC